VFSTTGAAEFAVDRTFDSAGTRYYGDWAAAHGFKTPAFLAVLVVCVVLTNIADSFRRPLDTDVTDLIGTVALRIFLAIAMLSLDWVSLFEHIPMLLTAAAVQVVTTVIIAVLLVYTLFGRGREGAAATGGFIGFSLGAMPVGLAVMRRLNARFGDTPRALLAITLAPPSSPIRRMPWSSLSFFAGLAADGGKIISLSCSGE
jgi:ESS family glutamate:Na+ symporter